MKDSADMVASLMHRLGYVKEELMCDVGDAIDVFSRMNSNKANLAAMGIAIPRFAPFYTKLSMLHAALTSPRSTGMWQIAPQDSLVREFLTKHRLISNTHVSDSELNEAMVVYARVEGLPYRRSYVGRVYEILQALSPNDPLKRD